MFKFFSAVLFSLSVVFAASASFQHDDLETPQVIAERPGMYRFTLGVDVAATVLERLNQISNQAEASFQTLLSGFIYRHPNTVTGVNTLWQRFKSIIEDLRSALGTSDNDLPFIRESDYDKSPSHAAAIDIFRTHVETAIAKVPHALDPDIVEKMISIPLQNLAEETQKLLDQYASFYASRKTPFRTQDIELYVAGLLYSTVAPGSEENLKVLAVLQNNGCLKLFGEMNNEKFTYSPKPMVEAYKTAHGNPATVILGCGHESGHLFLATLGLKDDAWCDDCKKRPHENAMVVSFHESSADILCDLNHPDLWAQLPNASVSCVADESWNLGCYTPETLGSIARVLKVGGTFCSERYYSSNDTIKAGLIALGLVVVEENMEKHTLILQKQQ